MCEVKIVKHKHGSYEKEQIINICGLLCKKRFAWRKKLSTDVHLVARYALHHSKAGLASLLFKC